MSTPYNRKIKAIVIHHMGDGQPPEVPIERRWNPYGYDYPEYDYGIEADGTIRQGRPLSILGAHTKSDKSPYNSKSAWWFNQNAIGIGLAGDFTKYPMPQAQFDGLVSLVKQLMTEHGLTLADVYPHGQVTYTDCPGCTYSQLPELLGLWDYDAFEAAVLGGDKKMFTNIIVYKDGPDKRAAEYLADSLRAPIVCIDNATPELFDCAETVYMVGGTTRPVGRAILISGGDRFDTVAEVLKSIGRI